MKKYMSDMWICECTSRLFLCNKHIFDDEFITFALDFLVQASQIRGYDAFLCFERHFEE